MGSWNKTCGISNLPITNGTEVYTVVLEETGYYDRCYTTALWKPVVLPFISKYNDYGGGENSHANISYILDGLRNKLVEMPLGENTIHDIAVSGERLDESLFFDAVHEGRLKIVSGKDERLVDFVMLRKDVVDSICDTLQCQMYVGDGKGNGGYENNYRLYTFADVIADIPNCIDRIEKYLHEDQYDDVTAANHLILMHARISSLFEWEERNLIGI